MSQIDLSNKHTVTFNKHTIIQGLRWEFALRLSISFARRSPWSKDFLCSGRQVSGRWKQLPNKSIVSVNQMVVNNRWNSPWCVMEASLCCFPLHHPSPVSYSLHCPATPHPFPVFSKVNLCARGKPVTRGRGSPHAFCYLMRTPETVL